VEPPSPDAEALRHEQPTKVRSAHGLFVASDEFSDLTRRQEPVRQPPVRRRGIRAHVAVGRRPIDCGIRLHTCPPCQSKLLWNRVARPLDGDIAVERSRRSGAVGSAPSRDDRELKQGRNAGAGDVTSTATSDTERASSGHQADAGVAVTVGGCPPLGGRRSNGRAIWRSVHRASVRGVPVRPERRASPAGLWVLATVASERSVQAPPRRRVKEAATQRRNEML